MDEVADIYTDQFQMNLSPYGATLNFSLTDPTPPSPGTAPKMERKATVRLSLEHLKVMAFVLVRQIKQYENQTGTNIQIPNKVLNSISVSPEDWDIMWGNR
jgi:hypothetical protein